MNQNRATRQIIYGSVSSLRAANMLSQDVSEIMVQGLQWQPSQHVTIIQNTQDGNWQLWPGDTTEGKPIITFTPYKQTNQEEQSL